MILSDRQWEFLKDVALLIQFAERKGWKLTGGELWRTKDQQQIYVDKGMSKTNDSLHIDRLAIDLNLFIDGKYMTKTSDYQILGTFWAEIRPENRWGGSWMDGNHFERNR